MFRSSTTIRNAVPVSATTIFPWVATSENDSKCGSPAVSMARRTPRISEAAIAPTTSSRSPLPILLSTTMPSWVTTRLPRTPGTSAREVRTLRTVRPSHDLRAELLEEGRRPVRLHRLAVVDGERVPASADERDPALARAHRHGAPHEGADVHPAARLVGDRLDAPREVEEHPVVEAVLLGEGRDGGALAVEDGEVQQARHAGGLLHLRLHRGRVHPRRGRGSLDDARLRAGEALQRVREGAELLAAFDEGLDGD